MMSMSDMILEHTFDACVKRMNKPKVFSAVMMPGQQSTPE